MVLSSRRREGCAGFVLVPRRAGMRGVAEALKAEVKNPDLDEVGKQSLVWGMFWVARLLKAVPEGVGEDMNDVMLWVEQAIEEKAERDGEEER